MRFANIISMSVAMAVALVVTGVNAQNVRLQKSINAEEAEYRVENAVGVEQEGAVKTATIAALSFAAEALTGDPEQKTAAGKYVKSHMDQFMSFVTPGKIFKRGFDSSGEKMMISCLVKVNTDALQRNLIEAGVITASRELAKGAGKPKLLVFYGSGDCDRGNESAPLCSLPKQIREAAAKVGEAEKKIMDFQQSLIDAGCFIPTEVKMEGRQAEAVQASSSGSHHSSGSHSGSASIGYGGAHASGHASHSSSGSHKAKYTRVAASEFKMEAIKASDNCKAFMGRFNGLEADYRRAEMRREGLQNELDGLREKLMDADITTIRVNEWIVNQRWDAVDAGAVRKAQRQVEALTSLEGLPPDPAAQTAMMAGADIFIEHDFKETSPNGGYQVHVTLKAYDVVTGKLLASTVGKSNELASHDKENATAEAVGRAMPTVLDQISAYWADMGREGVKTKIVFRGDFSNADLADAIEEMLDEQLAEELGRECDDNCAWESELSTKGTIVGAYVSPADAKKKIARKMRKMLDGEGIGTNRIVSQPSLHIMEVWF